MPQPVFLGFSRPLSSEWPIGPQVPEGNRSVDFHCRHQPDGLAAFEYNDRLALMTENGRRRAVDVHCDRARQRQVTQPSRDTIALRSSRRGPEQLAL
jgi:hypothetical protein